MKTRTRVSSIKSQLVLWLLIPLFALSVVKLSVSHLLASHRSQEIYDELLRNSADSIVARLNYREGKVALDFPEFAQALFRHNEKDKFWYKISQSDGTFLLGDNYVPNLPRTVATETKYGDGIINGARVRIISLPYVTQTGEHLLIEIAETCNARVGAATHVLWSQILLQCGVLIGSALAVWFGVNRGLAPLLEIEKAMSKRSPFDLEPLEIENAPKEVKPLISANNDLLSQLRDHIDAQADFASNAAHQLRTPLTGLKTYVSIGARASKDKKMDEIFVQLQTGVNRMTQLVNRLLSLARVESKLSHLSVESEIDLNVLTGEAITDLFGMTIEKQINLEYAPSLNPALIHGEPESIRELVDNILHNAICYTPKGGEIKVSVLAEQTVSFIVEDSGPGIPVEERERVFDRFYRVRGSQGEGSGLGLAIVKEIAKTHAAEIKVESGKNDSGCKLTLVFNGVKAVSHERHNTRLQAESLTANDRDLQERGA